MLIGSLGIGVLQMHASFIVFNGFYRPSWKRLNSHLICLLLMGTLSIPADVSCQQESEVVPTYVVLDTLFSIGAPDGPVDELIFRPQQGRSFPLLDLGPNGLVWIYNPGDQCLMIFNTSGQKEKVYGRSGAGPGEFSAVCALTAVEGGAWTWDSTNQQLCRWSLTEGLLTTKRTKIPEPIFQRSVVDRSGTIWYLNEVLEEPALEKIPVHLYCSNSEGEPVDIIMYEAPGAVYPGRAQTFSYIPRLTPALDDGVIIAPTYEYIIHFFQVGYHSPISVWEYPSTETPYSRRERQPGGRGGIRISRDGDLIEPPLLSHKPDIESIHRVNNKEIWVGTPVRNADGATRYDRIDSLGKRIGTVWFPGRNGYIRYDGSFVYVLTSGIDGYQVHKISITQPGG